MRQSAIFVGPALAIVCCVSARAANVDWKLYGGVSLTPNGNGYCFYDEKSIAKNSEGVRAWTKCLAQSDLDSVGPTARYYRSVVDMSANRIAHFYMPPMSRIERMNSDQLMTAITYESIADVGDITPNAQIFYEIDCSKRMMRELSTAIGSISRDTPLNWKYVPPEGNGANLIALLCPK